MAWGLHVLSDNTKALPVRTMSIASVDDDYNQTTFDIESDTQSACGSSSDESKTTAPSSISSALVPINKEGSERNFLSMTFYNHTTPPPQHSLDQDYDVQSVLSIDKDISSTVGSNSISSTFREAAADYLVKNFTDDEELLALYQEATRRVDEVRFVRNHRRLLKIYFLDLQSEEQTPSQKLAIRFLRPRSERIRISSKIHHILMPSDTTIREKINVLLGKGKDTLFLLNRHLEQQDSTARSLDNIQTASIQGIKSWDMDNTDTISEASEGSNDDTDNNSEEGLDEASGDSTLPKLKSAADFLTGGRPFSSYKENLRSFLDPYSKLDNLQLPHALSAPSSLLPPSSSSPLLSLLMSPSSVSSMPDDSTAAALQKTGDGLGDHSSIDNSSSEDGDKQETKLVANLPKQPDALEQPKDVSIRPLSFSIVKKLQSGTAGLILVILLAIVMCDATHILLRYSLWKSIQFLNYSIVGQFNAIFGTPQEETPPDSFREKVYPLFSIKHSLLACRLRKSLAYAFHSTCSLFLPSKLPPHITRIRWTCNCGHQSYDDFISERRVIKTIADRLSRSGIKVEIATRRESGITTLLFLLKGMALGWYRRRPGDCQESRQSVLDGLQVSGRSGTATHDPSEDALDNSQDISDMELQSPGRQPIQKPQGTIEDDVRFLHICIHMESNLPCTDHVMIDPKSAPTKIINCDQQLFREIKKKYLRACERRVTVFIKLKGIYFVQVSPYRRI